MKLKKDNFDYFILRHIIFLYGELKSIFLSKNYYSRKGYKYIFRFYIRYLSNYLDSINYYLNIDKDKISSAINNNKPKLSTHGYQFLQNIDLNKIDFVEGYLENYSDQTIIKHKKINYTKARNFSISNGFEKIVKDYLKNDKCNFEIQAWDTLSFINREQVQNSLWHRDRDGLKVLKIFIYLGDTTEDHGPHEYVAGSHLIKPLRFVPQIRYTTKNVNEVFQNNRKLLTGRKGTCFAVDTTGLHRSNPPQNFEGRSVINFTYYTGNLIWDENTQEIILNA
tara:strand:+ start:41 stop:880 length:840 start_codon:yes stop_codon:yes gene_type:complete